MAYPLGSADGRVSFDFAAGSVVAADFNGDGIADLAVANSTNSLVYVLLGNGDGTFQEKTYALAATLSHLTSEQRARKYRYIRQRYNDQDMLIAREPDEAGFYVSGRYHGEPFDETRFRVVRGGWDHEHCLVCWAKVLPGDEWWAAEPPHEIGLCFECHARIFGGAPA